MVQRSTAIAVENIKQHLGNLRPKYEDTNTWANQISEDQSFLLDRWKNTLENLASIKTSKELRKSLHGYSAALQSSDSVGDGDTKSTLQEVINVTEVEKAGAAGTYLAQQFTKRLAELRSAYESVARESQDLIEDFQHSVSLSDSEVEDQTDRSIEEIEVLARKIYADYAHILDLTDSPKAVSQASKIAHLHKTSLLPSLIQTNEEVNQLLQHVFALKDNTMKNSVRYLQQISIVESNVSNIHSKLASLDINKENAHVFDLLNFVVRLPSIYGSLLIECVRRWEWTEKMTSDSSLLVEEIATYKDEEGRRRKKWSNDMGRAVDLASMNDMALGIEVNIQAQKQKWPSVSREDINKYLSNLRGLSGMEDTIEEIEERLKAMDAPSKQQVRRAKAFKNGSIHEVAYGKTSLLLRGDDGAMLSMKSEKSKVEEKLKSAESRIRKLEDLLHRQSQLQRPSSATGFAASNAPTFERHATSLAPNFTSALSKARETPSRRSSVSSRRFSITNEPDDRGLAQRIVTLEAELTTQKAQSKDLERNAAARLNAEDNLKSQIEEAISTKEDLLGNLEAQQREFDSERRLLVGENDKLKVRLEELEDDFDRTFDNQEHQEKIHALEEELKWARNDANTEAQRARSEADSLRTDHIEACKKADSLQRDLQQEREEKADLNVKFDDLFTRLKNQDQAEVDYHRALRSALLNLSADHIAPDDFSALVETVETVAEKSAAHQKTIEDALETLRADDAALENRLHCQGNEIYDLRERLGSEERKVFSVREKLTQQATRCTTLQSQLDFAQNAHEELKSRFAAGETDSQSLRSNLTNGERKIADLLDKNTEADSKLQELKGQLMRKQESLGVLEKQLEFLRSHNLTQASRASDVTAKLYAQIESLQRLLEQIGFSVTKQDDSILIQKISRAASASLTLNDPSMSMKRSLSGPLPTKIDMESLIDTETLQWAKTDDPAEAARRYDGFVKHAADFSLDSVTEAIHKRVKEIEHIARKWQREARAYRDKAHRAQSEVHDRIALRSFKEGDLALFLPTRDQATKPWAAFNVGAPHYFLREQDSHKLGKRDWLIARISKVEERVVDLSRSIHGLKTSADQGSIGERSEGGISLDDENPYELSDGLRWYLLDAAEEKPGAPINVGLGKVTVASANVDAKGSIRMKKLSDGNGATKTLTRSLDSRRSSTNSKKGLVAIASNTTSAPAGLEGMLERRDSNAASLMDARASQDAPDDQRPQSGITIAALAPDGQRPDHVGIMSAPDW